MSNTTIYTKEVSLGHRKVSPGLNDEHSEELLEKGRNLRKSNAYPIECQVKLNHVWRMSKEQIETINRNRKRTYQEGKLPPSVPLEELSPYHSHWMPYYAIIPHGGISEKGYVKEAWIEYSTDDSIEINGECYDVIDPYVHDTQQWIQGFMLEANSWIDLLPSPKIVVKYFNRTTDSQ